MSVAVPQNTMSCTSQAITACLFGASTHRLYFRNGEHHLYSLLYLQVFFVSLSVIAGLSRHLADNVPRGWKQALIHSGVLHCFYLGGVYASLVIYRLLFHPLRKFPGPLDLRISAMSLVWRVRHYDAFKRVQDLHSKYGTFFRIGPSAVSVIHPAAVKLVHSTESGFLKGDFYDLLRPFKSLQMMRNKTEHAARRRVWSAAFSDRALRGYEKRTQVYQAKLLSKLAASNGKPINITQWFHSYSSDVASDLSFGESFGNLDSEKNHWVMDLMEAGPMVLGLMPPMWFLRMISDIPGMNRDWLNYVNYGRERMIARMKVDLPFSLFPKTIS
jgi:tryprostatin B 6-hydroxylase